MKTLYLCTTVVRNWSVYLYYTILIMTCETYERKVLCLSLSQEKYKNI